ncbi:MAG: transposase [Prochloraceae cyanobacterium]|nr:transposase [Prochloraceae cyanobacterium]
MNYRTQKILLTGNIDDEAEAYLLWCCYQSNSLYNSALFAVRQAHFEQCETRTFFDHDDQYRCALKIRYVKASYGKLCKDFKNNKHYIGLGGQQAQQCLKSVVEGISSYNQLLNKYWNKEIEPRPQIPNYRKKRGLYQVVFPAQAVNYDEYSGICKLAISRELRPELVNKELLIPGGYGITGQDLAEVRIVPACGQLWAEYVYQAQSKTANNLDYSQAIGLDPGVTNWLTVVSTKGKSFILCGKQVKSINQRYNKIVAKYKRGKSDFYWDDYLDQITHKRNCQLRDAVNKAARFIINYCLENRVGNIVFGWGQGVKDKSNLGKRNNQNFVQIPTARLKNRIRELAETVGIVFTETEESYTSKSSFLDNDLLPKFGEKLGTGIRSSNPNKEASSRRPTKYKFLGQRITRGTYKTASGYLISADAHGAANILKKVAIQLKLSLAEVGRGILTVPKRYDLSSLTKSYRKRSEAVFLTPFATAV